MAKTNGAHHQPDKFNTSKFKLPLPFHHPNSSFFSHGPLLLPQVQPPYNSPHCVPTMHYLYAHYLHSAVSPDLADTYLSIINQYIYTSTINHLYYWNHLIIRGHISYIWTLTFLLKNSILTIHFCDTYMYVQLTKL